MGDAQKHTDGADNCVKKGELVAKKTEKLGVLLIHGFTSSLDCVNGVVPKLEELGVDIEMPVLRGHGTKPEDLKGVTYHDWMADAEAAYQNLSSRVDGVIIVGLSMGGLVSLNLAANHPEVLGIVTWAAALEFVNPLSRFVGLLGRFFKMWPGQESFNDPECRKKCTNYKSFATDSFASLYKFAQLTRNRLSEVHAPICIIQSRKDQVVKPSAGQHIFDGVGSDYAEIHWLMRSGHELGQDMECDRVFEITADFVKQFIA